MKMGIGGLNVEVRGNVVELHLPHAPDARSTLLSFSEAWSLIGMLRRGMESPPVHAIDCDEDLIG